MAEGEGTKENAALSNSGDGGASWKDQFLAGDEFAELRDNPSLADVGDVPTLAKRFVDTKAFVGRKGVILPGENATPEELAAFHTALGRPEKPEDYEIAAPESLPEGFPYAPELESAFRQWAYEEGLSATQAKNLFNKYLKANVENFTTQTEAQKAEFKASQDAIVAELHKDWGDKYEENFGIAQTAMREFFPPGSKALAALDKVMGDEPDLIRMAYTIGKRMGEAGFVKGDMSATASLDTRRQELMASPAYTDKKHLDHIKVNKEVTDIYEKLYPTENQQ